jgi:D-xylose transport system ATP-binding protein
MSQPLPRPRHGEVILSLQHVSKNFGAVSALTDVSLDVHAGEVVALATTAPASRPW